MLCKTVMVFMSLQVSPRIPPSHLAWLHSLVTSMCHPTCRARAVWPCADAACSFPCTAEIGARTTPCDFCMQEGSDSWRILGMGPCAPDARHRSLHIFGRGVPHICPQTMGGHRLRRAQPTMWHQSSRKGSFKSTMAQNTLLRFWVGWISS